MLVKIQFKFNSEEQMNDKGRSSTNTIDPRA